MGVILEQIAKAQQRVDFDLIGLLRQDRALPPGQTASATQQADRQRFLTQSLGDSIQAETVLERVLDGNELQPVSFLPRGAIAAQAVARIQIRRPDGNLFGHGTGFLISGRVLITNNHVLPDASWATHSTAQFEYESNLADQAVGPVDFSLRPDLLFFTSKELDFSVVAVAERSQETGRELTEFGCLPLLDVPGKSFEGEWLTIVQHPAAERKQLCVRENRLLKRADDVLWYSTDTLGGSSGSPVFNNDWFVVALHHSGVPERRNGVIQTVDGRDFDERTMDEREIKWLANEGVRASRIVQTLRQAIPNHALLAPLFAATPESARITRPPGGNGRGGVTPEIRTTHHAMSQENVQTVTIPVQITLQISGPAGAAVAGARATALSAAESAVLTDERNRGAATPKKAPSFDAPFEADYSKREGFDPSFLGDPGHAIHFPRLSDALESEAVRLLKPTQNRNTPTTNYILDYHHFSVVMHKTRRLAIYSAANISFAQRYDMGRPSDVWREDPRIPLSAQITNFYYASNKFDRGHLTRREDLEFGATPVKALQSAADTCHWTNCTPQHEKFNQNKEVWQGIERHVLESAIIANQFKAQVFTGPVLDQGDPVFKGIPYPLRFWKVVAALNASGKLFATAYLASQEDVIAQFGIEAAPEVPFGPYKTFQVKIEEVERLTGLSFTYGADKPLSECDPLNSPAPRRPRRSRPRTDESTVSAPPSGYFEISALDDIITD